MKPSSRRDQFLSRPTARERSCLRFKLRDGPQSPVHPQGLDPAKKYTIREMNPAPGRAMMPQEGKTFTGEELMRDGVVPSCTNPVEASVIELAVSENGSTKRFVSVFPLKPIRFAFLFVILLFVLVGAGSTAAETNFIPYLRPMANAYSVSLDGGNLTYQVSRDGKPVIQKKSPLGLQRDDQD